MSTQSRYFSLLIVGPIAYVVVWLLLLPALADVSTRAAILSLTLISGLYCFLMAREKGRNMALWTVLGILAGFLELGLIPVLIVTALSSKAVTEDTRNESGLSQAT